MPGGVNPCVPTLKQKQPTWVFFVIVRKKIVVYLQNGIIIPEGFHWKLNLKI